jgi:AcrR family transcriptional regulator
MKVHDVPSNPGSRILDAASRLFYKQGYHATGINQVIANAGAAKASFYHHYGSKEDLCIAYLTKRHEQWFSWLQREVEQHECPKDRLLSLFTFLEKWLPDSEFRGCAFLNIASEFPASDSKIRAVAADHKSALRSYISSLVSAVKLSGFGDELISQTDGIYLLFEGAIISSQIHRSTAFIRVAREMIERSLDH